MKKCLFGLAAVGLLAAADHKKPNNDKAKLQGTWAVVAVKVEGRPTAIGVRSLTFDGDKVTSKGGDSSNTVTFKLDATQKPPHFDIISDGGKVYPKMLYRLDGDTLKLYGGKPKMGDVRPESYEAAVVVMTLRRGAPSVDKADGEGTGTVTGKVMIDGKPLKAGKISFHQDNSQFIGSKIKDGKYKVDRVPASELKVTVEGKGVPLKYASDDTSGLVVTVVEGGPNVVTFDLK